MTLPVAEAGFVRFGRCHTDPKRKRGTLTVASRSLAYASGYFSQPSNRQPRNFRSASKGREAGNSFPRLRFGLMSVLAASGVIFRRRVILLLHFA